MGVSGRQQQQAEASRQAGNTGWMDKEITGSSCSRVRYVQPNQALRRKEPEPLLSCCAPLGAPSKAALLPFPSCNGNFRSEVRGVYMYIIGNFCCGFINGMEDFLERHLSMLEREEGGRERERERVVRFSVVEFYVSHLLTGR